MGFDNFEKKWFCASFRFFSEGAKKIAKEKGWFDQSLKPHVLFYGTEEDVAKLYEHLETLKECSTWGVRPIVIKKTKALVLSLDRDYCYVNIDYCDCAEEMTKDNFCFKIKKNEMEGKNFLVDCFDKLYNAVESGDLDCGELVDIA